MPKSDADKAPVMMQRKGNALHPVSQWDFEALQGLTPGVDIEVKLVQRRSLPQMRAYWVWLGEIIAATEAYPTAEKMHESLKFSMGYTTQIKTMGGQLFTVPDSIAFSKMGPVEFRGFVDRAIRLVNESFGIDVPFGREQ
jgi:hypothetical protein